MGLIKTTSLSEAIAGAQNYIIVKLKGSASNVSRIFTFIVMKDDFTSSYFHTTGYYYTSGSYMTAMFNPVGENWDVYFNGSSVKSSFTITYYYDV